MSADRLTPATLRDATQAQREIAEACEPRDRLGPVRLLAGADTSMAWRDSQGPPPAAAHAPRPRCGERGADAQCGLAGAQLLWLAFHCLTASIVFSTWPAGSIAE